MRGSWLRGIGAGLSALMLGITLIIRLIAGDAAGMASAMLRFAPPAATGLPEGAYPGIAEMITGYLTGAEAEFRWTALQPDGTPVSCFHDYEAAHMADCRGLIFLDTWVCGICAGALLLLLIWQFMAARRGRGAWPSFLKGALAGQLSGCALAAVLCLWALIDFDSLFILFHRVAFTNELWLLNPRTDLLIRLMPQDLFVFLGVSGLGWAAAWITGGLLLTGWGIRRAGRNANGGKTEAT